MLIFIANNFDRFTYLHRQRQMEKRSFHIDQIKTQGFTKTSKKAPGFSRGDELDFGVGNAKRCSFFSSQGLA